MRRIATPTALFVVGLTASSAMAMPGFETGVRGIYWFPDLSAKVQTFEPSPVGTKFNARDDLGVDEGDFPSGEAFLRIGRFHLRAGYLPLSFDGSKALDRDIVFNGRTFAVADNVVTDLDVEMVDAEIQVDLLRPNLVVASFTLGLVAKVKYINGEAELRSASASERKDFRAPIPMAGLAAGAGFLSGRIRADGRATGIAYSGNRLFEGDLRLSIVPLPFVRLQGGYRLIDLELDENDIDVELRLSGPYAGVEISF